MAEGGQAGAPAMSGEGHAKASPTSVLTSGLTTVASSVTDHSTGILNVMAVAVTFGAESFIGDYLFECPCLQEDYRAVQNPSKHQPSAWRVQYGISFFLWPALALFFLALAINGEVQRCLTGTTRHCSCRRHLKGLLYLCGHAPSAVVPASAWLVFVFLNGWYLECIKAKLPTACIAIIPVEYNKTEYQQNIATILSQNAEYRTISQLVAWTMLGIGIVCACLGILCSRFCGNVTYYQQKFMNTVRAKELEIFERVADEVVEEELEKKWRAFMHQAQLGDWEAISQPAVGGPKLIGQHFYYSPFHEWQPRGADKGQEAMTLGVTDASEALLPIGSTANSHRVPDNQAQAAPPTTAYVLVTQAEQKDGASKDITDGAALESKTKASQTKHKDKSKIVKQKQHEGLRSDAPPAYELTEQLPKDPGNKGHTNQAFDYNSDSSVDWEGANPYDKQIGVAPKNIKRNKVNVEVFSYPVSPNSKPSAAVIMDTKRHTTSEI